MLSAWVAALAGMMILPLWATLGYPQGFLPPPAASTQPVTQGQTPLLIDGKVPESLTGIDAHGNARSLLSFKSSVDILFVVYLSPRCNMNMALWPKLRRLQEDYSGWRVAFIAVSPSDKEALDELTNTFKQEKVLWPLLRDDKGAVSSLLAIYRSPEALLVDESGALIYRGPVDGVRKALDTVISHIETLKEPEPPLIQGCAL